MAIRDMNGGISSIVPVDYTARISAGKAAYDLATAYTIRRKIKPNNCQKAIVV